MTLYLDTYADGAATLLEVSRVLRAMRHDDLEKLAYGLDLHRRGLKDNSEKRLSSTAIFEWANKHWIDNKPKPIPKTLEKSP